MKVFFWGLVGNFILLFLSLSATQAPAADNVDSRYVGELHRPLLISQKGKQIAIFFLKNNLRGNITSTHVAAGEIYYFQVSPLAPELNYVWKVEGDQISSVFFTIGRSLKGSGDQCMY